MLHGKAVEDRRRGVIVLMMASAVHSAGSLIALPRITVVVPGYLILVGQVCHQVPAIITIFTLVIRHVPAGVEAVLVPTPIPAQAWLAGGRLLRRD